MASPSKTSHLTKWREISRTCDACLKNQANCDGRDVPGHHCSACLGARRKCTYVQLHKALEEQIHQMESLLRKTQQYVQDPEYAADVEYEPNVTRAKDTGSTRKPAQSTSQTVPSAGGTASSSKAPLSPSLLNILRTHDPHDGHEHLRTATEYIAMEGIVPAESYLDGTSLVSDALELKHGSAPESGRWGSPVGSPGFPMKRPEFWEPQKWEQHAFSTSDHQVASSLFYTFPEEDLLNHLVQRYFDDANWILPVLHRPTFEAALANHMHLTDDGFARVALLVCAVGSTYSDDVRVLLDPTSGSWHTAGVRWFEQVVFSGNTLIAQTGSLFDLQAYCLASIFLHTSPEPHIHWNLMSMGILLAQEIGIHRHKVYNGQPNVFDEQWKRAFWILFLLDIWTAWFLGRPRAMRDEDIDVELPVEVDDEYWYHPDPSQCFKQPSRKPSYLAGFNQMIGIMRILGVALRVLYSPKRSIHVHGSDGPDWADGHVKYLSGALDDWQTRLPVHLRWDPSQSNLNWFRQSALLRGCYYNSQLTIYRPFLPRKAGPEADASLRALKLSMSLARSFAQTVEIHFSRTQGQSPFHVHAAFQAGMFLLVNIWTSQKLGIVTAQVKNADMDDVHRCMEVLKGCETRWPLAGKYWDLLDELAHTGA